VCVHARARQQGLEDSPFEEDENPVAMVKRRPTYKKR